MMPRPVDEPRLSGDVELWQWLHADIMADWQAALGSLNIADRASALAIAHPQRTLQFVAGRLLADYAERRGMPGQCVSHGAGVTLIALAKLGRIGLDIQPVPVQAGPLPDGYTPAESDLLNTMPPALAAPALALSWSLKEAVAKRDFACPIDCLDHVDTRLLLQDVKDCGLQSGQVFELPESRSGFVRLAGGQHAMTVAVSR